jgi:hypothetical protein
MRSVLLSKVFSAFQSIKGTKCLQFRLLASIGNGNLYLQVPFAERETVKALGAKWDNEAKKWYVPMNADPKPFNKWLKTYLNVPYEQRSQVKELGAIWDPQESKWFINPNKDPKLFSKWIDGMEAKTEQKSSQHISNSTPSSKQWHKTRVTADTIKPTKPTPTTPSNTNQTSLKETVLLIDCDTNGLPSDIRNFYPPYSSLKSYDTARIVQLSYALCDRKTFDIIESGNYIIRAENFSIENTEFHGITKSSSLKKGVNFPVAAEALAAAAKDTSLIIAHNTEFVMNIVKSEFFRHALLKQLAILESKKEYCTMLNTMTKVQVRDIMGRPKVVALKELVKHILNEDLPEMHNSQVDVNYLRRALQKMVKEMKFELNPVNNV